MHNIEKDTPRDRMAHLVRNIRQIIHKTDRKLAKQIEELEESRKSVWYQQIGDSLLACNGSVLRGTVKFTILNIHTQTEETISINPKLNLKENAQLYYKKAKKGKRGEDIGNRKVESTRDELLKLQALESTINEHLQLKTEPSAEVLNEWEQTTDQGTSTSQNRKESQEPGKISTPYRYFTYDGWDIYVGRTDSQNDELTTRFAHPADIWIHVAGHPGSHVIIQRSKGKPFPPPEVIKTAACLSVWFSKAKHTSYAEVHYTEARFVHKRRHSPPGEVIAERCKSIRVSPRSPQDLFPSTMYSGDDQE
jgi:predicted ribosome quality control (RQC) complex YloA/Tae2 family protein